MESVLLSNFDNFANHLILADLNLVMQATCLKVESDETHAYFYFDQALDSNDLIIFNDVVANYSYREEPVIIETDEIKFKSTLDKHYSVRSNPSVIAGSEFKLVNVSFIEGAMSGFDLISGEFTIPEKGMYQLMFKVNGDVLLNSWIKLIIKDELDNILLANLRKANQNVVNHVCEIFFDKFEKDKVLKFYCEVPTSDISLTYDLNIMKLFACN